MKSTVPLRSLFRSLSVAALVTVLCSVGRAQATAEATPSTEPAPAAPAISEEKMLEVFGWMTGMRTGINQLGLSDEEAQAVIRGLEAARRGEELDVDLQAVGGQIAQFMQAKFDAHVAEQKAAEEAQAATFWEELRAREGVKITASGLGYEIQAPGGARTSPPSATCGCLNAGNARSAYRSALAGFTCAPVRRAGAPCVVIAHPIAMPVGTLARADTR